MTIDRRTLLNLAALPLVAGAARAFAAAPASCDEAYWRGVAAHYDRPDDAIQLENGNWGAMARPVLETYQSMIARVNRDTSYYARRSMGPDMRAMHQKLAGAMGVEPEELVLTRNATEALMALITGYNRLKAGDSVLYADLDYDSMQAGFDSLAARRGVQVVRITLPEPATRAALIEAYAAAFAANTRLRLVLLTHVSHRTGLVLPVAEIAALARARGIDCIVDAAHSFGQIDYRLPDLGADFIGVNVHKWVGAPLGVGAMIIRKGRVDAIDRAPAEPEDATGAKSRVHTGTVDFAALLTVPAALDFQASIGAAAREARLRALRDRWVTAVRDVDGLDILTPDDPTLHCAITSFRIRGRTSVADNMAVAQHLLDRHRIFTVHRTGPAKGACVRVTPALMNDMAEVDRFAVALRETVAAFRA
ncbi:aminotransferase class V-fold PLP-dependent enzyme [Sphingomonas naphthae]|uniref:Aminotransferase class V-fold PLP-dependent enzyme n=1 Tax=Sphingomonas naphthae TaxID=1813468 RepID=A0ABY7TPT6_9SPHN|nr:aminotransferase class V-fold PLP-dependent enzyme [Sphingomonas naphthae]WCT75245.1 aminotransferase class V-fold PLP-dependent enzyme [Sphingomonas naphthae]